MSDKPHKQFTSSPEQWAKLKPLARQMRHQPTHAEDMLWKRLRNRQVGNAKFRRQHSILGFVVDFVCIERHLVIEVDGSIHEEPDQHAYDLQRQSRLEAAGFQVLRFSNAEVQQHLDEVLEAVGEALQ